MARKPREKDLMHGKSTGDLLNISMQEFLQMDYKKLKNTVQRLASTANKRIKYFEKRGEVSHGLAFRRWNMTKQSRDYSADFPYSDLKFSTQNRDLNQLRAEYKDLKTFLGMETTTAKGWNKVKEKTIQTMKRMGIDINNDNFNKIWNAYNTLTQTKGVHVLPSFKYRVFQEIRQMTDNFDTDAIVEKLTTQITELYEEQQMQDMKNNPDIDMFGNKEDYAWSWTELSETPWESET